jgi:phosphoribosylformylglycinamidine cyclo-ligase
MDVFTEAGESAVLLGEAIPAAGAHRVVYNGHLDLTW